MSKYTYKDIIIDPKDPRLEGAIGKECYSGDTFLSTLKFANENINCSRLTHISPFNIDAPFSTDYAKDILSSYDCSFIILKKEEAPKYRPFKGEEILSVLGRRVIEKDSVSDSYIKILSLITSVALKDEDACIRVASLWLSAKEFLEKFEFYNEDGTTSPCGVLEEEA